MSDKPKKLSTDAYKGVRDFFPEDMVVQNYIFGVWRKTAESFGYEQYDASVLEPAELYRAKSGEEIVGEQTYTFIDRGDREVTLRPEMTPTVARMVAAKKRELVFPLRWYSIPNLFRYEQPQRGRVREHWQLNADMFGIDSVEADVEIISLAYQVMKAFGAKDGDFAIRINSRKLLQKLFEGKLANGDSLSAAIRLLDRKAKMPIEAFDAALKKLVKSPIDLTIEANDEINAVLRSLTKLGIKNAGFDPILTRGFDYYTGMIFEIFDTNPENRRSLFGGGRYDDLTSLFGGDKVPAVGFGMGDVTIRDFLETHGLLPGKKAPADIALCIIGEQNAPYALDLAQKMRGNGARVSVDLSGKKVGDQISNADKRGIPKVIVIGDEEAKTGKLKVKTLAGGGEVDFAL